MSASSNGSASQSQLSNPAVPQSMAAAPLPSIGPGVDKAQPEPLLETLDFEDERDDSPYCDCGSFPDEEEQAANRCSCCGKMVEL